MDPETIKENDKRFFDYVNKKDMVAVQKWIDDFVDDDFINHSPVLDVSPDKDGFKEMFKKMLQLFPDMTITPEEMVFEKDILCFRHIIQGVGANDETMGIAMVRFKNGKAVDRWVTTEPM